MRLINVEELPSYLVEEGDRLMEIVYKDDIDVAPEITPESLVKRGRWEKAVESKLDTPTGEYWEGEYYNCLECDYASDWNSPYCPNCGAKMVED